MNHIAPRLSSFGNLQYEKTEGEDLILFMSTRGRERGLNEFEDFLSVCLSVQEEFHCSWLVMSSVVVAQ